MTLDSNDPFDNALVIAGPTASGKTQLALALAQELDGEIIGADALQLYRDVPVTTCQPTAAELAAVPHHLIGTLAAAEKMTAARFGALAREAAAGIVARGRRVLLVGGTGLYLRAALEGLVPAPPADEALRAALTSEGERGGRAALHAKLAAVDPESAARLNPNDLLRVVRSLEVHTLTGRTQTELHRQHRRQSPRVRWIAVDQPRERLYDRIAERTRAIFPQVLAEAKALEAQGLAEAPAARALGIAEALGHLRGQVPLADAIEATIQTTRRYAKRQLTWFRAVAAMRWLSPEAALGSGVAQLVADIRGAT